MLWEIKLVDDQKVITDDLNSFQFTDYKSATKLKCQCGQDADLEDFNRVPVCEDCLYWRVFEQMFVPY